MHFRPLATPTDRARCSSAKLPYPDERSARQAAEASGRERDVRLNVYRCNECFQWHLTSREE